MGIVYLMCFAAWVVSVVNAIQYHDYLLLFIDFLIFPIGVIHGFFVMLGG